MSKYIAVLVILGSIRFNVFPEAQLGRNTSGNILPNNGDSFPYVQLGDKIYFIETTKKKNWFGATHYCSYRRLKLASLETVEETRQLSDYLIKKAIFKRFWICGNDLEAEGEFKWSEIGQLFRENSFSEGQPDNKGNNENCIEIWKISPKYEWNDRDCNVEDHFICEENPGTVSLLVW